MLSCFQPNITNVSRCRPAGYTDRSGSIKALIDYLSFKTGKNTFKPLFNLSPASLPDSSLISC